MEIGQSTGPTPNDPGQKASRSRISSDFDTFLRMMTAQMRNQDPLNPVDSNDFATQLATFSSVEQAVITNDLLRGLSSQLGVAGLADMAGWVGKEARAAVPVYFDGSPITLFPNPLVTAESGEVVVRDAGGFEVQRITVPAGEEPLIWTGTDLDGAMLVDGVYEFTFVSLVDDAPIGATPVEVYSRVTEVQSASGETQLILKGGIAVSANDITGLRDAAQ